MSVQSIYSKLMKEFNNSYGVCGLMGNLQAESGLSSTNMQNSYEKKLGMTDDLYTTSVDNGDYTNFVKDGVGYGLAQWTYYTRKQKLLDYVRSLNKSIGDEDTQVDFLIKELKESYKTVYNAIKSATSVKGASDIVLTRFEQPKDQSDSVKTTRAGYGQALYDQFNSSQTATKEESAMSYSRQKVVDLVTSWEGKKESDGSHKFIIDLYNKLNPLPRNYKLQYTDAWCAGTWSALAQKLSYTAIMPVECSCYYLIEAAKKMGVWQEKDDYVPTEGDGILYDWQDNGVGDNTGNPDHVGTVIYVNKSSGYMIVMEGNYSDSVKRRTVSINGKYIRGFITPKYTDNKVTTSVTQTSGKDIATVAREVIAGVWGSGEERKTALTKAGYDYATVQAKVNSILNTPSTSTTTSTGASSSSSETQKEVVATCSAKKFDKSIAGTYKTTTALYLRNDAGKNKKALVCMPKDAEVHCYGYYNLSDGNKWYYVQVTVKSVKYTGFCHSGYLKKS